MGATVVGAELGVVSGSVALLGGRGQIGQSGFGLDGTKIHVNAATGNLNIQRLDEALQGLGTAASALRTYNSLGSWDGDNADNWQLGLVQRVVLASGTLGAAGSTLRRTAADGSEFTYSWNTTAAAYVAYEGGAEQDRITFTGSGATLAYQWRDGASQAQQRYDSLGRLVQVQDRAGNRHAYTYTGSLLTQVRQENVAGTSSKNETLTLVYDTAAGRTSNLLRIERREDYEADTGDTLSLLSTRVYYAYDASNRLSSVTVDLSPGNNSTADNHTLVTLYTYDGSSKRVASITQMTGAVYASATDRANPVKFAGYIAFTYYAGQAGGAAGQLKSVVQSTVAGQTSTTSYTYAAGSTTVTDAVGGQTVLSYDAAKRLTRIRLPDTRETSFVYVSASDDHLASVTDAAGRTTSFGYDALGNRVLERDAAGNTVTRTYSSTGTLSQLLTETRYTVADPDGAGALLPSGALTRRQVLDGLGRVAYQIDETGRVTRLERNALGQVTASITYAKDSYDISALAATAAPTQAQVDAWVAARTDKTQAQVTLTSYDHRGQVARITRYTQTDATGAPVAASALATSYLYDPAGQLISTVDHRGPSTSGLNLTNRYQYDGLGRVVFHTNAVGQVRQTLYLDANGDGTAVLQLQQAFNATDGQLHLVAAAQVAYYDQAGRLVASQAKAAATNGLSLLSGFLTQTTHLYDAAGRLLRSTTAMPSGGDIHTLRLYDSTGRLVGEVDAAGSLTEYEYNAADQRVRQTRYATAVNTTALANAVANSSQATLALLRPAANAAADATDYRVYDSAGRLVRTVDAEGRLSLYTYDAAHRLVAQTQRANALSATQRANLAAKAKTLTAADADLVVAANAGLDRTERHFHDASGRLLATLDAAGYLTEHQHDAAGRLIHSLRYATQSNPTQWASGTLAALKPAADVAQDQHTWFLYDSAGRRTGVVDAEGYLTETQYDGSGNATATIRYQARITGASASSLPTALATSAAGVSVATLRPRTASRTLGDHMVERSYNAEGWVDEETATDGTITKYSYDAAGNVASVRRASNDATQTRDTYFAYDQLGHLAATLDGRGSALLNTASAATYADDTARTAALLAVWTQNATQAGYDNRGLKVQEVDALGNRTLYYYDDAGRLTHRVNALGEVELRQYDALGRVTQTTQVLKRIATATLATLGGGRSSVIVGTVTPLLNAGNDATTTRSHDRVGNVLSATAADGLQALNTYDSFNQVVRQRRQVQAGQWVSTVQDWDQRGLLTYRVSDDQALDAAGNATTGSALMREAYWEYDAFGRTWVSYDGNWNPSVYGYDRLGRQVSFNPDPMGLSQRTSYDMLGRVLTQTDRLGKVTTTAYNDTARSVTVTTPEGVAVTTTRNRHGETVSVANAQGTWTYRYDLDGHLVASHNPANAAGVDATKVYDKLGRLVLDTDDAGRRVRFEYDALGRVLKRIVDPKLGADGSTIINAAGLDLATTTTYRADTREVWTRDERGIWTRATHDKLGRLVALTVDPTTVATDPPGVARTGLNLSTSTSYDGQGQVLTVTDPRGVVTRDVYDDLGRRTSQTLDYGTSKLNLTTSYVYDAADNVVQRTDARGAISYFRHDAEHRLTAEVDAEGYLSVHTYDAEGRRTATTRYANRSPNPAAFAVPATHASDITTRTVYNADGRAVALIDGEGYVTEQVWGSAGQLKKTIRYATPSPNPASTSAWRPTASAANDRSTETFYDAAGRAVAEVDGEGYVTETVYDAAGLVTGSKRYANKPASTPTESAWRPVVDAARDRNLARSYDAAGRLQTETDGEGVVTRYKRDASGNVTELVRADGTTDASTLRRVYDAAGRVVEETTAYGKAEAATTRHVLDAQGNRLQTIDPRGVELAETDSVWALAQRKAKGYVDVAGNALLASALGAAQKDALRNLYRTQRSHDNLGRVKVLTDALGATIQTEYDANGNVVKVTDQRGQVGFTWYDKRNLAVLHVSPLGRATATRYDAFGQRTGSTQHANAAVGTWSTATAPAIVSAVPGSGPYVLTDATRDAASATTYDRAGRVRRQTDASGAYTENSYGAFGQASSVRNALGGITNYLYDRRGLKTKETLPVTSLNASNVATAVANEFTYDARGNLLTLKEASGLPEQRLTTYTYDRQNRLKTTTGQSVATWTDGVTGTAAPVQTRSYDRRGNLIEEKDARGRRTLHFFDALDREVATLTADGTLTAQAYDDAGNVVRKTVYADAVALPATAGGSAPAPVNAANKRETLYAYDADNRLKEERIQAVLVGRYNPATSQWQSTTQDVVTTYAYDATGNRIARTDSYGNTTHTVYNALGEREAEVDAAGYLSTWQYNALGQVQTQLRHATALNATARATLGAPSTTRATLAAAVGTSADDRKTSFTYDKLGRVLTTTVGAVQASTVNASTGAVTTAAADATTSLQYNGLGQVTQRTEATGEVTNWTYDTLGRQVKEQSPTFIDVGGVARRRTTDTVYNGLGLVRSSTTLGTNDAVSTDDRITRTTYNAMGWVASETDALGNITTYAYDLAGNRSQVKITVKDADGKSFTRLIDLRHDTLNREVWRRGSTLDVAANTTRTGDLQEVRYNPYGEITGRRTNGGNASGAWQETAEYNALGKVIKTNSASGSSASAAGAMRMYFHDANGNATLMVTSASTNLAGETQAGLLAKMANTSTAANYHATISIYDERNLLTKAIQPKMDSARESTAVTQFTTQVSAPSYAGGSVSPTSTLAAGAATYGVATIDTAQTNPPQQLRIRSVGVAVENWYNDPYWGHDWYFNLESSHSLSQVTVWLPSGVDYGGQYVAVFTGPGNPVTVTAPRTSTTISWSGVAFLVTDYGGNGDNASAGPLYGEITVYQENATGQRILLGTGVWDTEDPYWDGWNLPSTTRQTDTPVPQRLLLSNQSPSTDRVQLYYRPQGSSGSFSTLTIPKLLNASLSPIAGAFQADLSSIPEGTYEYFYVGLGSDGTVLNRRSGVLVRSGAASITQDAAPQLGGAGKVFVSSTGSTSHLNFTELGTSAASYKVYTRAAGSTGSWNLAATLGAAVVGGVSTPGWAQWDLASQSGHLEVRVDALTGGGALVKQVRVTANLAGAGSTLTNAPVAYQTQAGTVSFAQAAAARTLVLQYRLAGSGAAFSSKTLASSNGVFTWPEADALVADKFASVDYEYSYTVTDGGGQVLNKASGVLRLGAAAGTLSHVNETSPTKVQFSPPQAAAQMKLQYREKGTFGAYTPLTLIPSNGLYSWDVTALLATGKDYEYIYELQSGTGVTLLSAAGTPLVVKGVVDLAAPATTQTTGWSIGVGGTAQATVQRSQAYNAFGEVRQEVDGRGNVTDLVYNTLGKLVTKLDPTTNVTLRNGFIERRRPTTTYYYDKAGNLLGSQDANGNTTSQTLLNLGDGETRVLKSFHADGGMRESRYDLFGQVVRDIDEIGRVTDLGYDLLGRLVQVQRPQRASGTASYIATRSTDQYEYDALGNRIAHTDALGHREKTEFDEAGRVTRYTSFAGFSTSYGYAWDSTLTSAGGVQTGGWRKTTTRPDTRTLQDDTDVFGRTVRHKDLGDRVTTYTYNHAGWLAQQTSTAGQNIAYSYYANGYIKAIADTGTGMDTLSRFEYDNEGNRTFEAYTTNASGNARSYYQFAEVSYDELNRVVKVLDPKAEIRYEYDAVGNRRRVWSYYHDGINGSTALQDYWYDYDSMNRFVISMGKLTNGARGSSASDTAVAVVRGPDGVQLGYDKASQRTMVVQADGNGVAHTENYSYTADGYVEDVKVDNVLRFQRTNDALGRVTRYQEYAANGSTVSFQRNTTFDADNRALTESDTDGNNTSYAYYTGTTDANSATGGGDLHHTTTVKGGTTVSTYYAYQYWDEAKQVAITATPQNASAPGWRSGYSKLSYDVNGHLLKAEDVAGSRTLTYTNDAYGQVMTRNESGVNTKRTNYFYLNENRIGEVGDDGTPVKGVSYAEQLSQGRNSNAKHGDFRYGRAVASADFDQNYQPINGLYPASTAFSYTVKSGDTLQSIARALWGDATMWYLIAEANGLRGTEALVAGQRLTIPNKVTNIHNSAQTFKVYDAGEAIGDVMPTIPDAPPPPPPPRAKKSCGGFGMLITFVVAVVAMIVAPYVVGAVAGAMGAGTAAGAGAGAAAGAGAGAAGAGAAAGGLFGAATGAVAAGVGYGLTFAAASAVSQGLQIAVGARDKFSWAEVGIAGLSAGLTAGLGEALSPMVSGLTSNLSGTALQAAQIGLKAVGAATINALGQGMAVGMGLQQRFDWAQVGLAAAGGAVGEGLKQVGQTDAFSFLKDNSQPQFGWDRALGNTARAALRAGVTDMVTQGLSLAMGTAKDFDWAQVATAAGQAGLDQAFKQEMPWSDALSLRGSGDHAVADKLGYTAAAALGGGLNKLLGQGLAIAVGKQPRFNWMDVAMAAGNAAVDQLVDKELPWLADPTPSPFAVNQYEIDHANPVFGGLRSVARAGLKDVLKQGLGNLTGQQVGFNWQTTWLAVADAGIDYTVAKLAQWRPDPYAGAKYEVAAGGSNFDGLMENSLMGASTSKRLGLLAWTKSLSEERQTLLGFVTLDKYKVSAESDNFSSLTDLQAMGRAKGFNFFGLLERTKPENDPDALPAAVMSSLATEVAKQGLRMGLGLQQTFDTAPVLKASVGAWQGRMTETLGKAVDPLGAPVTADYWGITPREMLTAELRPFGVAQARTAFVQTVYGEKDIGSKDLGGEALQRGSSWEMDIVDKLRWTSDDFKPTFTLPQRFGGG